MHSLENIWKAGEIASTHWCCLGRPWWDVYVCIYAYLWGCVCVNSHLLIPEGHLLKPLPYWLKQTVYGSKGFRHHI